MIHVVDLSKHFGRSLILKSVNLRLSNKETLVILGPSGSGKTTLLRLVAGFEKPDGGTIQIDSKTISSSSKCLPPKFRNMAMIFQDLALWPHMSVFENVAFALENTGCSKTERAIRVEELLVQVSLLDHADRYPHQLSGGEKQRLAIARAIGANPQFLLMDEPFNNLDPFLKEEMMFLTNRLKKESDIAILYVTHNFDEVFHMADRLVVLIQGTLGGTLEKAELDKLTEPELARWYSQCLTYCDY